MFEDSPIGIHATKQANLFVIAFTGFSIVQDVSEADLKVNSYAGALEILQKGPKT